MTDSLQRHPFEGRTDRDCTREGCGLPDRAEIHKAHSPVTWLDFQPRLATALHSLRGHRWPASKVCASCQQDADQLARAAYTTFLELTIVQEHR